MASMKPEQPRRTRGIDPDEEVKALPAFVRQMIPSWCPADLALAVIDAAVEKLWNKYSDGDNKKGA